MSIALHWYGRALSGRCEEGGLSFIRRRISIVWGWSDRESGLLHGVLLDGVLWLDGNVLGINMSAHAGSTDSSSDGRMDGWKEYSCSTRRTYGVDRVGRSGSRHGLSGKHLLFSFARCVTKFLFPFFLLRFPFLLNLFADYETQSYAL
jgi:hypothetical protein